MRKEPSNNGGVGMKRTSRSAGVHSKPSVKRASSEGGDSEKKRKGAGGAVVGAAPPTLPLALVVVEVQTAKAAGGKAGVESKVKKKSVTLKTTTVPVKKIGTPKKFVAEPVSFLETKGKQMKPKKEAVLAAKPPKLKTKKVDPVKIKKPAKPDKKKPEKLTKKQQQLSQEKALLQQSLQQQSQKKMLHPNDLPVPTPPPITLVITETTERIEQSITSVLVGKKTGAKVIAKKQNKVGANKKVGVASGKIGKRKKEPVKKTVVAAAAKQAGKLAKKENTAAEKPRKEPADKPPVPDNVESSTAADNNILQIVKKPTTSRKSSSKPEDKRDLSPNCNTGKDVLVLPSPGPDSSAPKAKSVVKGKASEKSKQVKVAKKKQKLSEQADTKKVVNDSDVQNDDANASEVILKTEPKKKEKVEKVSSSKADKKKVPAEKEKKHQEPATSKPAVKVEVGGKGKKMKQDNKIEKKQQPKLKAKSAKLKKGVKLEEDSEKHPDSESEGKVDDTAAEDNNDSSTSDEIPLEFIKRQQKCKQQPTPDTESKSNITTAALHPPIQEIVKIDDTEIKIKQEIESQSSCESTSDRLMEDTLKLVSIKNEKDNSAGEKKTGKTAAKKVDLPKKLVESKTKKEAKPSKCTVSVGIKAKKKANPKGRPTELAKLIRSDEDSSLDSCSKTKEGRDKKDSSGKSGSDSEKRRRMKLFGFWSGPKKHRVASLNALAKVHCLYENESRGMLLELPLEPTASSKSKKSSTSDQKPAGKDSPATPKAPVEKEEILPTRTLRSAPGLRSVGRHYDILNASSTTTTFSSSEESSDNSEDNNKKLKQLKLQPSVKQKQNRVRQQQQQKKKKKQQTQQQKQQQQQQQQSTDATSEEEDQSKNYSKNAKSSSSSSSEKELDGSRKVKKRRKRNELVMDLKDMVVRKRMASLNASAILAASYSSEKRSSSSSNRKDDSEEDSSRGSRPERKRKSQTSSDSSPDMEVEDSSCEEDVLIRGGGNKQKVAVILNQDTDVTITGVYVNSTTRSTHHEGFCSIAGMQYRISSTSHTQTEATAVATETVLHADHPGRDPVPVQPVQPPCKSYTPLGALSSMQPPGHGRARGGPVPGGPPSPGALSRRHGCSSSAFTAPPLPPPPAPPPQDPTYVHGYYQPAGPLISHHHHHHTSSTTSSAGSSGVAPHPKVPPPPTTAAASLPTPTPPPSSAPQPVSESSDNEVVISGSSSSAEQNPTPVAYRYPGQPPYPHPYNYQYYPSPPATASLQYPAPQPQSHYHQEICYSSPSGYPPAYFHHKAAPYSPHHGYHRRYVPPPQYYPPDFYPANPPSGNPPPPPAPSQQQMIVTAAPPGATSSSTYQPGPPAPPPSDHNNYPQPSPAPPMVDSYPPPPPPPYYSPAYSAGPPPPACYSHSPPGRSLAFIDATYQGCPCPLTSCPKNVHTGPLTGASKGSGKGQGTTPLPPVALALPLEPPGAVGPPSPARGSAGMPPPPSPALATARNPPLQWNDEDESSSPTKSAPSETGLLVIGKVLSDAVRGVDQETNGAAETLIALSMPRPEQVKTEIEEISSSMPSYSHEAFETKPLRKRRRLNHEVKRLSTESCGPMSEAIQIKSQSELQERFTECEVLPASVVEQGADERKHHPVESVSTTSPVKPIKKRKLSISDSGCNYDSSTNFSNKCINKKLKVESVCNSIVKDIKKTTIICAVKEKDTTEVEPVMDPSSPNTKTTAKASSPRRRMSKTVTERRKSSNAENTKTENLPVPSLEAVSPQKEKKTPVRTRKFSQDSPVTSPVKPAAGKVCSRKPLKNITAAKGSKKELAPLVKKSASVMTNSAELSTQIVSLRRQPTLKWSNGWSWEGVPVEKKVFLTSDDLFGMRKCYPAMRHIEGDVIKPHDCVLLKSGLRKSDLPYVAKLASMWENPDDGEMMLSLFWYYRPEHTDRGRCSEDNLDEIFASRHKDTNSVACIEDRCYVLTFNEYCRYRTAVRIAEDGMCASKVVPVLEGVPYPRAHRQPPGQVSPDLVFFCRRVYDFRQKRILKNPS